MAGRKSDDEAGAEAKALGEALSRLRRERGLSQAEAGARIAMSSQGWGLYETGKRSGLFRPDIQRRLTSALDATPEDLALLVGEKTVAAPLAVRPALTGVSARGRGFEAAPAMERRQYQLDNDDLSPWAAAGTVLEYIQGRWPRRDQGCVIAMKDGSLKARLYMRSDDSELVVRGAGALLSLEKLDRNAVASVSAVVARLDE